MYNCITEAISATSGIPGEVWECGTNRGDMAVRIKAVLTEINDNRIFRMFDIFTGQPFSGPFDHHPVGSMGNVNIEDLKNRFINDKNIYIHSGVMPDTFKELDNIKLSLTNIDVDNYDSVKACLEFVYPKTQSGGIIFLDDYACPACPGARKAVDEFMIGKKEHLDGNAPAYIIKQ